jgi:hypothetical protein
MLTNADAVAELIGVEELANGDCAADADRTAGVAGSEREATVVERFGWSVCVAGAVGVAGTGFVVDAALTAMVATPSKHPRYHVRTFICPPAPIVSRPPK